MSTPRQLGARPFRGQPAPLRHWRLKVLWACATLSLAPGCALHVRDKNGLTHVFGFVCETRPSVDSRAGAMTTETTRNLGVMLYASPSHRGVSIGYNAESITLAAERTTSASPAPVPAPTAPDHE